MHTHLSVHHYRHNNQIDSFLLHGIIDMHAERQLEQIVDQATAPVVQLDFSAVGRINSMGIALLLRAIKSLKNVKQAEVQIYGLNHTNSMLFKMTGIFLLAQEITA